MTIAARFWSHRTPERTESAAVLGTPCARMPSCRKSSTLLGSAESQSTSAKGSGPPPSSGAAMRSLTSPADSALVRPTPEMQSST